MSRYAELIKELRGVEHKLANEKGLGVPRLEAILAVMIANQITLMRGVAELLESLPDKPSR